jgi:predicted dienelactone hydrolase
VLIGSRGRLYGTVSTVLKAARVGFVVALAIAASSACASETGGTAASVEAKTVRPPAAQMTGDEASAYAGPGPYPVGVTEITSGPTPISVFYPALAGSQAGKAPATYDLRDWLPRADAAKVAGLPDFAMAAESDLPPAADGGPFPLVLFSHGFAGYRLQSTFLTTHLASWGFVVAAVEHPYRNLTAVFGDLSAFAGLIGTDRSPDVAQLLGAIDIVKVESNNPTSAIYGLAVDTTRIGAVGHSLGGFAVFAAARDPRIESYVALAFPVGGSFVDPTTPTTTIGGPAPPSKPSLLIAGTDDAIAPLPRVEAAYASLPSPKRLAVIGGMTHLGFTDICALTPPGTPDVLSTAKAAGIAVPPIVAAVFADGCDPKHTAAQAVWPALDELTTAHLAATLGVDKRAFDFVEADLAAAFPALHITLSESP